MTLFRYKALDREGRNADGQMEANTIDQAIDKLQETGLLIVEIQPLSTFLRVERLFKKGSISSSELVRFTQQLATLIDAGQPLESALALLARQSQGGTGELAKRLQKQVKSGAALSSAMSEESQTFSSFYLSLVRAGEAAGMLGQTLLQLEKYLERSQSQRGELISALIYPAFLVVGVLGSLVLLMAYVVPQFVPIFRDLNVALPLITTVILALGEYLLDWGSYLLFLGGMGILWFRYILRDPIRRVSLDSRLLRTKVLGPLFQGIETARFALMLGTLLERKVSLLSGMSITRKISNNLAIQAALEQATLHTKDGHSLSVALELTAIFPELAVQMIGVGEQTGRLSEMLLKLADVYDKETQRALKRFMAALVPILTLIMTVIVAVIMLAIMLPLMSLTSNI
ncbi:type II secretion system F family protein [Pseudomonas sp. 1912-s]|uniref:type II secretion system F family protein n=1 Tax=Pseudomonas sp. 1912-s TaxID=3033802 RepID=UPI0023DF3481|nr:type II secretion system F family protein [Pseudomonas sp. 1912-s]MDF3202958.1 type II secretion system F family protein [Pseudomonas sp. 1912-s]